MRQVYLWHEEDIQWLRDVHLKMMNEAQRQMVKAAVVFGNEDGPDTIHLYSMECPTINDKPFAEFHSNPEGDVIILNEL